MTETYYGTGRRKMARARVFLRPGSGSMSVNSRTLEDYFPDAIHRMKIRVPFELTETGASFDALITVSGVRNSWLTIDTNWDFTSPARRAASSSSARSLDTASA